VTYEYVLLAGVNDSPAHAKELAALLHGSLSRPKLHAHVNLIRFNAWPGVEYTGSSERVTLDFQQAILGAGLRATVRSSRGGDILGACGQLASSALKKRPNRDERLSPSALSLQRDQCEWASGRAADRSDPRAKEM